MTPVAGRRLLYPNPMDVLTSLPYSLSLALLVKLLALGAFSGFSAGLLGVGGGAVIVPFMQYFLVQNGVPQALSVKMAIATAMGLIVFTSVSSARAHHARGAVRWDLVAGIAPGILLGAVMASAGIFALLNGSWLALVFAAFVTFSGYRMLRQSQGTGGRTMPGKGGQFAAGSVIGFASGLVGAGGGFISVPFMTWCQVPVHRAVATSAALGFPIALFNTLGYVYSGQAAAGLPAGALGYVWLPALACMAVSSMTCAPLGAAVAHRIDVAPLRRLFACTLLLLGAYMLYRAVSIGL